MAGWNTANSSIGPLQSDKQFFGPATPLPSSWASASNLCYGIEQSIASSADWPACVISYKVKATEADLQNFLTGLPAAQQVIFTWWQEPENDTFSGCPGAPAGNGPNFVCYFTAQSASIRQAAAAVGRTAQVFVAADAESWMYSSKPSHNLGTSCSFIPSSATADYYLIDHYDQGATGVNMTAETGSNAGQWNNWLSCVQGFGKPIGLAEYGLDCTTSPDQAVVTNEITADSSYLAAIPSASGPVVLWEYWWSTTNFTPPGCQFDNSAGGVTAWQSAETQNGGG